MLINLAGVWKPDYEIGGHLNKKRKTKNGDFDGNEGMMIRCQLTKVIGVVGFYIRARLEDKSQPNNILWAQRFHR